MKTTRRLLRTGLVLTILPLFGCGYALVGKGSNIPEDVRNILVVPLANQTPRLQVDQLLSEAIADEMVLRQRFTVVNSIADADAELSGSVTRFNVIPVRFDNDGVATEYEISIGASMQFKRTESDEVLWENSHYIFRENYVIDVDEAGFFDRENLAIAEVSVLFAETLITDLQEGF